jgi:hypothetical protein
MLIMLRWSSKSRCRVQVTSNVRHPNKANTKQSQDTRFGKNPRQCCRVVQAIASRKLPRRMKSLLRPRRKRRPKTAQSAARRPEICASRRTESQAPRQCVFQLLGPAAVGGKALAQSQVTATRSKRAAALRVALLPVQGKLWQHPNHGRRTCSPRTSA